MPFSFSSATLCRFPCLFLPPSCSLVQQDIARGRGMVDELFQGWGGTAGTQNAIMSSQDYLSQVRGKGGWIPEGIGRVLLGERGGACACACVWEFVC
jgi:hypothetical protein